MSQVRLTKANVSAKLPRKIARSTIVVTSNVGNGSHHSNKDLPILLICGRFGHGRHLARWNCLQGTLFLLKRIVNDKWKPAFKMTSAPESLVKPLNKADSQKLQRFLGENDVVVVDFESFSRPVDAILNLGFALPRRSDFKKFKREFEAIFSVLLAEGLTSDAILKVIAQSDFASHFGERPRDATLQFICKDHEIRRRNLVYRELEVHNF